MGFKLIKPKPKPFDPDFLFFSDLHLHERAEFSQVTPSGLNSRFAEGLDVLRQILFDVPEKYRNIENIVFLGDLFHLKDRIPTHMLVEFRRIMDDLRSNKEAQPDKNPSRRVVFLRGTHDYNLPEYSIMELFDGVGFQFIDEPCGFHIEGENRVPVECCFIPYIRDSKEFKAAWEQATEYLKSLQNFDGPRMVLFHQDVAGALYESGMESREGASGIRTWPGIIYLGGHIHEAQKLGRIQYLGDPYPTKFGESNAKFVWLFDSETRELRPIQVNYPMFQDVPCVEELTEDVKGNYVRIVGEITETENLEYDRREVLEEANRLGAKFLTFSGLKVLRQRWESLVEEGEEGDDEKIIEGYFRKAETELDKDRLIKTSLEIFGEV